MNTNNERRRPKGRTVPPQREAKPRETDIAYLDRAWFDQHPHEQTFTLPAHPWELRAYSLPPGSICRVIKIDHYRQARAFAPPSPAEAN